MAEHPPQHQEAHERRHQVGHGQRHQLDDPWRPPRPPRAPRALHWSARARCRRRPDPGGGPGRCRAPKVSRRLAAVLATAVIGGPRGSRLRNRGPQGREGRRYLVLAMPIPAKRTSCPGSLARRPAVPGPVRGAPGAAAGRPWPAPGGGEPPEVQQCGRGEQGNQGDPAVPEAGERRGRAGVVHPRPREAGAR